MPHGLHHHSLEERRILPGKRVQEHLDEDILPSRNRVSSLERKMPAQRIRNLVPGRKVHDVGRRPLKHRHVCRALRHCGNNGYRRSSAADHDNPLAFVIEIRRPFLRMDECPAESLHPVPLRQISAVVVVIAGAEVEEAARDPHDNSALRLRIDRPARSPRGPRCTPHAMIEADLPVDAVFAGCFVDVLEYRRTIGDCLCVLPRPETVAERVHVGIRSDARIAKEVPCAAECFSCFEDQKTLLRALSFQMARSANP